MAPSQQYMENSRQACDAMKRYGISPRTVRTTLKRLLKAYDKNWKYIEDDDYRVLLDAILEPEGPKLLEGPKVHKGPKLLEGALEGPKVLEGALEGPKVLKGPKVLEGPKKMEFVKRDFEFLDEPEEEEIEPLKRKPRVRSEATSSKPAGYSCENMGKLCLEYNNTDIKANENKDVASSPEFDIASSSNGEVKFTFSICKPPFGFQIPGHDVVMKRVEDIYREKLQGFGTQSSLAQVLKHICQCFMEQGNASDHVGNKLPCFNNFKEPVKNSGYTNDPIPTQRFVVSSESDHCFSGKLRKRRMVGADELSGCSSLTNPPKEQSTGDLSSKRYRVTDITRGLEKQKISLVNEVDDEKLPAFTYIPKSVNYKTANVKFMLARVSDENSCPSCFGDCLFSEVPCACAVETGGEFAYTTEGLVGEKFLKNSIDLTLKPTKKDYFFCDDCPLERMKRRKTNQSQSGSCKGHLVRKFIKECWLKCGCDFKCGNRVVQRGIQAKLQVFMTPEGKGWGLRTLELLPRGAFVCEYVGEIVTNSELFERNERNKNEVHTYPVLLDADWSSKGFLKDEEALCLDATSFGNVARFINHRCVDANMVEIPVEVESPNHHYYHHAFFTTREVKAMEELTWDYGIDFDDDSYPVKAFPCKCGSKLCKADKRKKRNKRGQ